MVQVGSVRNRSGIILQSFLHQEYHPVGRRGREEGRVGRRVGGREGEGKGGREREGGGGKKGG